MQCAAPSNKEIVKLANIDFYILSNRYRCFSQFSSFLQRGSFYNIHFKLGKKTQKSLKPNELKLTVLSTEDTTVYLQQKIDLGKETKKSIRESELESITFEHRGPCCPLKQIINNR